MNEVNITEIILQIWDIALIFLLIVYILFLIVLHKYRYTTDLSKSFFRLAFLTGIADIIYVILNWLNSRTLQVLTNRVFLQFLIDNENIIGPIIWYGVCVSTGTIHYLAICLSAHRFSAVLRPIQHSKVRITIL
jgi:hypothetical protein